MAALVGGFVLGMLRLLAEINKASLGDGALFWFGDVNFLYFALILTGVSVALLVAVSFAYPEPTAEKVRGLTYATTMADDRRASRASWNARDVALSVGVLAVLAAILVYFSPLGVG